MTADERAIRSQSAAIGSGPRIAAIDSDVSGLGAVVGREASTSDGYVGLNSLTVRGVSGGAEALESAVDNQAVIDRVVLDAVEGAGIADRYVSTGDERGMPEEHRVSV